MKYIEISLHFSAKCDILKGTVPITPCERIKYMFKSKRQKEILESTESKLTRMFEEFNSEKRQYDGRLVCETQCTMARIRAFSDFMYLMKVRPLQTACYYGAAVMFLLMLAAFWCKEWLLGAIFGVLFLILATLPHNMRIQYFNKRADRLEDSFSKVINADFTGEDSVKLTISAPQETKLPEQGEESAARTSETAQDKNAVTLEIPYKDIYLAYECSHSFYLFPDKKDDSTPEAIICDKTQFLCGTPMQLRDKLARGCGKRFKIKVKKA